MKLKKAIRKAKTTKDFNWVAVDSNGEIYAYEKKPSTHTQPYYIDWDTNVGRMLHIGYYTGKKYWADTLRLVK